jgi:hypothetical protein
MEQKKGSIGVILMVIILLVIVGGTIYFVISKIPTSTSGADTSTQTQGSNLTQTILGDINRDGKVTQADVNLVQASLGCKKADACWTKSIGKTLDGDNPMYTSDLDMNADGVIDQKDVDFVTNNLSK